MNFKKCLFFVLSLLVICTALSACKNDETDDDPDDDDNYSGSIAPDDTPSKPNEGENDTFDEGDPNETVHISTAEGLKSIKPKGTYILTEDIDLEGAEWTPVGSAAHPFSGTLKSAAGKQFKIKNFRITNEQIQISDGDIQPYHKYAYGGFFGVASGATIENVVFENVTVNVSKNDESLCVYAGAVAGYAKNETKFSGVTVNGSTVTANSAEHKTYVGGLVGSMNSSSKAENCSIDAEAAAGESANDAICGGISGELTESELIRCVSNGSAKASAKYGLSYSGGLIGYCSSGKISKCVAKAEVISKVTSSSPQDGKLGAAYAGGAVAIVTAPPGGKKRAVITESYAEGKVTAQSADNAVYSGGFAAKSEYGIYTDCYSRSTVNAESENQAVYAAGFIAHFIYTNYSENSEANDSGYSYDTNIKGCLALGEVNIKTGTKAFFLGKLVYSDAEKKDNKIPFVDKSGYRVTVKVTDLKDNAADYDNKIYDTYLGGNTISLNISFLKDNLGWNDESWEIKNGYPTLK